MCKCDPIFTHFQWENLSSLDLGAIPQNPGVYVIRVKDLGKPIDEAISYIEGLIAKADWPALFKYVNNRVSRINNIGECPIIYTGSAPNSLQKRYVDLCGRRHTVFFPIYSPS